MDDKAVVMLISSDDEDIASQPESKKRKCMVVVVQDAAAVERSGRSGGVHLPEVESTRSRKRKWLKRRKKKKNKINSEPQHAIANGEQLNAVIDDLGTSKVLEEEELVLIPDNETPQKPLVYAAKEELQADKFEDIEKNNAMDVCEIVRPMVVIGISSSEEDKETAELKCSSVDEGMLLSQPIVGVVKKGEHPDSVKAVGTVSTLATESVPITHHFKPQQLSEGKQVGAGKSIKRLKLYETKSVEENNNIVLQKLLRGPRYFDPLERNRQMCFHCGEEGHKTVVCTANKRKKPCFVCAGFGHNGMNCRQGQECFNCKGLGHYAKNCPNKNDENHPTSNICLRCGDSGHDMWTCKSDYPHDDLKEIQCHVCKNFGHLCCVDYPGIGSRQVSCCNCGRSGHVGSECTKVEEKSSGSRGSKAARKGKKHAKAERAQRVAKEERAPLGSKSVPRDLNKAQGKIKIQYEEKASTTVSQPRWRNGRNTDGRRTLCFTSPGSNVWRAPATSAKNNEETSAVSFGNLSSPRNPSRFFPHPASPGSQAFHPVNKNQETYALSVCGNFSSPQNPIHMFNQFATPGSQAYQLAKNIQETSALPGNFLIPQNPFLMFNSPPILGSQAYLPANYNQQTFTLPASRNFSVPQNPVQMFNHHATPGSQVYRARFYPPWSGNFSFGDMRKNNW